MLSTATAMSLLVSKFVAAVYTFLFKFISFTKSEKLGIFFITSVILASKLVLVTKSIVFVFYFIIKLVISSILPSVVVIFALKLILVSKF